MKNLVSVDPPHKKLGKLKKPCLSLPAPISPNNVSPFPWVPISRFPSLLFSRYVKFLIPGKECIPEKQSLYLYSYIIIFIKHFSLVSEAPELRFGSFTRVPFSVEIRLYISLVQLQPRMKRICWRWFLLWPRGQVKSI